MCHHVRLSLVTFLGLLLLLARHGQTAESDELPANQQELLRALEKDIATGRGLAFKSAVAAQRVSPQDVAGKGNTVRYDPAAKKLLLTRDPTVLDRAEVIRGLVRALLDQHFDLAALRKKVTGA